MTQQKRMRDPPTDCRWVLSCVDAGVVVHEARHIRRWSWRVKVLREETVLPTMAVANHPYDGLNLYVEAHGKGSERIIDTAWLFLAWDEKIDRLRAGQMYRILRDAETHYGKMDIWQALTTSCEQLGIALAQHPKSGKILIVREWITVVEREVNKRA